MHLSKSCSWKILAAGLAVGAFLFTSQASAMNNFASAKKKLPEIYKKLDKEIGDIQTVYCGCDIVFNSRGKWRPDLDSCGYEARKNIKRARGIEAEHIVPAWEFGHQMKCWQEGGRKACGKVAEFKRMEGDLHNLYPATGEINGDRGNFQFSDWNGRPNQYGQCDFIVDFKGKKAQPSHRARGIIARAYFYMEDEYDLKISRQQKKLYRAWDKMYPPTEIECRRNELIKQVQGNENKYISRKCH